MNILRKIKDAVWWVKYRTTHRYHIINIAGEGDYDHGWIDKDHAMFLACFKLLRQFVEEESNILMGRDMTLDDYTSPSYQPKGDELKLLKEQIARENEIRAIYIWWTKVRPAEKQAHGEDQSYYPGPDFSDSNWRKFYDTDRWKAWCAEADRLDAKDEEMFDRLMRVRHSLWT